MDDTTPQALGLIAGKGVYPLLLAEAARKQGVKRIACVAFKGETSRSIAGCVDELTWINVGQLARLLDAFDGSGVDVAVMAGQITPTNLFRVRMDGAMLELLKRLPHRNAETIFGAVSDELAARGVTVLPASSFMQEHMPEAGVLTRRPPSDSERTDIDLGRNVALATSDLDIGQTVVIKEGTILAVEAFEGTNATLRRAGKLGGNGIVVVKLAKQGHDMRFDIPVIGMQTLQLLRKLKAGALAVEAGRCIFLERPTVIAAADSMGLSIVAMEPLEGSAR